MEPKPYNQSHESHEQSPEELAKFEFRQPDGSNVMLDFSAPGMMGDFAFTNEDASKDQQGYWVYHTGTQALFNYFTAAMIQQNNALEQFEKLCNKLDTYSATMTATTESESSFGEYALDELSQRMNRPLEQMELNASGYGESALWVTPQDSATICEMDRDWDDGERLQYGVSIPHDQAWQFLAGMIWRSYSEDGRSWPQNSRHATSEFERALDVIANALYDKR